MTQFVLDDKHQSDALWRYYECSVQALASLRSDLRAGRPVAINHFLGLTNDEVDDLLSELRAELNHEVCLALAAYFEGVLRVDMVARARGSKRENEKGMRDLNRHMRGLLKEANGEVHRVRWDEVLDAWKAVGDSKVVGAMKPVVKFRHWLAHGRYFPERSGLGSTASPELFMQEIDAFLQEFPQAG
ncbi:MAG: hypothetical protein KDD82_07375 [Planctomycetes bacterium]|nr:hypothetical protein [Planctomycetota bacterium]